DTMHLEMLERIRDGCTERLIHHPLPFIAMIEAVAQYRALECSSDDVVEVAHPNDISIGYSALQHDKSHRLSCVICFKHRSEILSPEVECVEVIRLHWIPGCKMLTVILHELQHA